MCRHGVPIRSIGREPAVGLSRAANPVDRRTGGGVGGIHVLPVLFERSLGHCDQDGGPATDPEVDGLDRNVCAVGDFLQRKFVRTAFEHHVLGSIDDRALGGSSSPSRPRHRVQGHVEHATLKTCSQVHSWKLFHIWETFHIV